jgi:hypothetical protein
MAENKLSINGRKVLVDDAKMNYECVSNTIGLPCSEVVKFDACIGVGNVKN